MYITAAVAMSLNGFMTDGDDPKETKWTSIEDKSNYGKLVKSHNLIVMGKNTFLSRNQKTLLSEGTLRLILVKNPQEYNDKVVEGQLEFSNLEPKELVTKLEKRGFSNMLLTGGSYVYSLFLNENLIDEFFVTIEPIKFSTGVKFLNNDLSDLRKKFNNEETKILNKNGTRLVRFTGRVDQNK